MVEPELVAAWEDLRLKRLVLEPLENNCWFVTRPSHGTGGIVVDAPSRPDLIRAVAERYGIRDVLITHRHPDHVGAAAPLADAGLRLWIHPLDADGFAWARTLPAERATVELGGLRVEVIPTPGHTPGSTCFRLGGALCLTGDTLFPGGPGKTAGPDAFARIIASIRDELFGTLPDECTVAPGHGATTTIGAERASLPSWVERGW